MNKTNRRMILAASLLGSWMSSFGQSDVEVKMLVQPFPQVEYILNDTGRLKEVEVPVVRLPAGDHHLVFWAPNCGILDTVLHLAPGTPMVQMRKILRPTPEYLNYRRHARGVWLHKAMWRGIPLLVTIGFGIKAYSDHKAHDQAYDDLHALQDSYPTLALPSTISALKQVTIPAAQQKLDDTRQKFVISMALCGAGALATIYGFIRAGKLQYPSYQDKEKVRFDGLAWIPEGNTGMVITGISIPLR